MPWRQLVVHLTAPENVGKTFTGVFLVLLSAGLIAHSYWVCTNLAHERNTHEEWMKTSYAAHTQTTVEAIHAAERAIDRCNEFNKELRRDLDLRKGRWVTTVDRVEGLAVTLEFQAREFRKAALTFIRAWERDYGNARK